VCGLVRNDWAREVCEPISPELLRGTRSEQSVIDLPVFGWRIALVNADRRACVEKLVFGACEGKMENVLVNSRLVINAGSYPVLSATLRDSGSGVY
jgi:hypothetical protein